MRNTPRASHPLLSKASADLSSFSPSCRNDHLPTISDTVKSWDAKDMSRQIELNIGKDLQFIRVNGTLVGGTIGLILFLLSQVPTLIHSAS
ncbi:DUF445 family protein [Enterobacter bugandensis]|uniref:DUF445 family protein n=1 Tax=Enterobacter bugandensis TaxID=881260 RepID=UPI00388FDC08